jgi:hypothetical protein
MALPVIDFLLSVSQAARLNSCNRPAERKELESHRCRPCSIVSLYIQSKSSATYHCVRISETTNVPSRCQATRAALSAHCRCTAAWGPGCTGLSFLYHYEILFFSF